MPAKKAFKYKLSHVGEKAAKQIQKINPGMDQKIVREVALFIETGEPMSKRPSEIGKIHLPAHLKAKYTQRLMTALKRA